MRKILALLIVVICSMSCIKDYDVTITGVDFQPIKAYVDFPAKTEFLNSVLIFGADFSLDPPYGSGDIFGPRTGKVSHVNPVLEDKFVLTSNQDLFTDKDTIKAGENLVEYFEYKMIKRDFRLSYYFKSAKTFLNETGYYKFFFTAFLSDSSMVSDSCIVKIYF